MELRNENVSFYVQLKIPVPLRVGFVMCCYVFLANSLLPLCSPVFTVSELCFSRHRRASICWLSLFATVNFCHWPRCLVYCRLSFWISWRPQFAFFASLVSLTRWCWRSWSLEARDVMDRVISQPTIFEIELYSIVDDYGKILSLGNITSYYEYLIVNIWSLRVSSL